MDFFVVESEKNEKIFPKKHLAKELSIYNFYPLQMSDAFQLVYIFSKNSKKDYFRTVPTHTNLMHFFSLENSTMEEKNSLGKENDTLVSNKNSIENFSTRNVDAQDGFVFNEKNENMAFLKKVNRT